MEGFPQSPDELRFMCSKGFYADTAIILEVSKGQVIMLVDFKYTVEPPITDTPEVENLPIADKPKYTD